MDQAPGPGKHSTGKGLTATLAGVSYPGGGNLVRDGRSCWHNGSLPWRDIREEGRLEFPARRADTP